MPTLWQSVWAGGLGHHLRGTRAHRVLRVVNQGPLTATVGNTWASRASTGPGAFQGEKQGPQSRSGNSRHPQAIPSTLARTRPPSVLQATWPGWYSQRQRGASVRAPGPAASRAPGDKQSGPCPLQILTSDFRPAQPASRKPRPRQRVPATPGPLPDRRLLSTGPWHSLFQRLPGQAPDHK